MKLIELNLEKIYELCRKYKVKTLSVFGSILTEGFDDDSDVDLLVNFLPYNRDSLEFDYVRNYFDLRDSLESLFGRKVDLIEDEDHLNPLFRKFVYNLRLIPGGSKSLK